MEGGDGPGKKIVAPHAGSVDRNVENPLINNALKFMSLPTRGAWIEIALSILSFAKFSCRSPRGERG